jgi:hypothetical protein
MENIAPPLRFLLVIKRNLEKGQSPRQGVLNYLKKEPDAFTEIVAKWYSLVQQGLSTAEIFKLCPSLHRRVLLQLVERGIKGESIYPALCQLENEICEACHEEIANKLARLPFLLLVPLLLMQFPAILLLLFGPLLQNFFHSLGGG